MLSLSFSAWLDESGALEDFSEELLEGRLPAQNTTFSQVNQPFTDYKSALQMAQERQEAFVSVMQQALQKGNKGMGEAFPNIKSEKSFVNKTQERGKPMQGITDVLRGTIIVDGNAKAVRSVARALFGFPENPVAKFDYKDSPRPGDSTGFFGSYNIDITVDGLVCEIQVMTRKLYNIKNTAHGVYDRYRTRPEEMPGDQGVVSRVAYNRANRPAPVDTSTLRKLGRLGKGQGRNRARLQRTLDDEEMTK